MQQPRRDVHGVPWRQLDVGQRRAGRRGLGPLCCGGAAPPFRADDELPSLGDANALVAPFLVGVVLEDVADLEVERLGAREAVFFIERERAVRERGSSDSDQRRRGTCEPSLSPSLLSPSLLGSLLLSS